ncbi:N6-adenine-specific methylase [Candidatus Scalindua japonica]|uniref:N6-adenine-specific methylase n=1 Tax=Candidatus Scalindua japonica TaxID=1284222 RepID=A0A286TXN6_9BACT|nr:16S rRNA (guanine(966)-N(2))-methyltransferase RsmD [Candidatus Scalindua japonica]GAX60637.1 N6-adenine-specific methylase [Candidatus Scalindua japonica]
MRIISGKAKGVRLSALSSKKTRPILDRAKESLFSILGDAVQDSVVLDLFAGTGSLGAEALSRGAKRCLFVDNSTNAIKVIKKNLRDANLLKRTVVLKINVFRLLDFIKNKDIKFDIILVAPPYKLLDIDYGDRKRILSLIEAFVSKQVISEKGIIVLQHHKKQKINQECFKQLNVIDDRQYSNTQLTFLKVNVTEGSVIYKS